ncbi:hypothetical protein ACIQTZ_13890 [Paenarthrobacter sp. NPDC090520]|uniref:hypothetical protein n=1 Tax=unclassified Paenarthrobacter TaxID=2634190 RepID=UPI00381069C7
MATNIGVSTPVVGAQSATYVAAAAASALAPDSFVDPSAADAQKRINIKPILDWIRWAAPYVWNAMVDAVKWGWGAFVGWWNGLAGWIRSTINWFIGGAVWEFYVELRRYFFGW